LKKTLLGLLFFALLSASYLPAQSDTSSSSNQLLDISISLQNTANLIESYGNQIDDLLSQIQSLKLQSDTLQKDKADYLQAWNQLELRLTSYQEQVADLQAKVKTLLKNYAGLLALSKQLRDRLTISNGFSIGLGAVAAGLLVYAILRK